MSWRLLVAQALALAVACIAAAGARADPPLAPVPGSPFTPAAGGTTEAFSADGKLLVLDNNGNPSTISLYAVTPGGTLTQLGSATAGDNTQSAVLSPNGEYVAAAATTAKAVLVFQVGPGGTLTAVHGSPFVLSYRPIGLAFNPAGTLLAVTGVGTDSLMSVGSDGSLTAVGTPVSVANDVSARFSRDGTLLATVGVHYVSLFRVGSGGSLEYTPRSPAADPGDGSSVAISPDGKLVVVGESTGPSLTEFTVGSDGGLNPVTGTSFPAGNTRHWVAFNPSGSLLAVASSGDDTLSLYGVGAGGVLSQLPDSPLGLDAPGPFDVAFAPTGGLLAMAHTNGQVSMFSVAPPAAGVRTPVDGAGYAVGRRVTPSFGCADAAFGPGVASCTVSSGSIAGGLLDTRTVGRHTFTVTAASFDGQTSSTSVVYTVATPPSVSIRFPRAGGAYSVGQAVPARYSCTDSRYGPGIVTCVDSNGALAPYGALDTRRPGRHSYSVTALSADGERTVKRIVYFVRRG